MVLILRQSKFTFKTVNSKAKTCAIFLVLLFFPIILNSSLTLASVMSDIYNTTASCSPPDGGCAVVAVGGAVVVVGGAVVVVGGAVVAVG